MDDIINTLNLSIPPEIPLFKQELHVGLYSPPEGRISFYDQYFKHMNIIQRANFEINEDENIVNQFIKIIEEVKFLFEAKEGFEKEVTKFENQIDIKEFNNKIISCESIKKTAAIAIQQIIETYILPRFEEFSKKYQIFNPQISFFKLSKPNLWNSFPTTRYPLPELSMYSGYTYPNPSTYFLKPLPFADGDRFLKPIILNNLINNIITQQCIFFDEFDETDNIFSFLAMVLDDAVIDICKKLDPTIYSELIKMKIIFLKIIADHFYHKAINPKTDIISEEEEGSEQFEVIPIKQKIEMLKIASEFYNKLPSNSEEYEDTYKTECSEEVLQILENKVQNEEACQQKISILQKKYPQLRAPVLFFG